MSGIAGIVRLDERPAAAAELEPMLARLAHRGPDGVASWSSGTVAFGHAMLRTTPESLAESLPFHDRARALAITSDARIDNREELGAELGLRAAELSELPDSGLILRAYERWGDDCPRRLLGDFAFAIQDSRRAEVFCARDAVGARPFYYHHAARFVAFASEVKALLALESVPRRLDEEHLAAFLTQVTDDRESTYYRGIVRLPPASWLRISPSRVERRTYWRLEPRGSLRSEGVDACAEALRSALDAAVRCRLRSAHPAAVLLSGGLDSSSVAVLAARHARGRGERITALSSVLERGHEGPEIDESRHIAEVVRAEPGIDLVRVDARGRGPFDGIDEALWIQDGPFRDAFHYMSRALFEKAAALGARVLLDGYGGDFCVSSKAKSLLADLFRRGRWATLARLIRERTRRETRGSWMRTARRVLSPQAPAALRAARARRAASAGGGALARYAIQPEFAARCAAAARRSRFEESGRRGRRGADLHGTIVRALEGGQLVMANEYFANLAAACGLESSHPMLDRRLLELCVDLPPEAFDLDGLPRGQLRRAMRGILPESIRLRPDKGPFVPDFSRRCRASRHRALELIADCSLSPLVRGYVDLGKVGERLSGLEGGGGAGRAAATELQVGSVLPLIAARFLRRAFAEAGGAG